MRPNLMTLLQAQPGLVDAVRRAIEAEPDWSSGQLAVALRPGV
jgi:hypothetical protein